MKFADVLARIAKAHAVAPENFTRLSARVKHLQKQGFPAGTNTGRGIAAEYDESHLIQIYIVMEICSAGATPEAAIELFNSHRIALLQAFEDGERIAIPGIGFFGGVGAAWITMDFARYGIEG